MPVTPGEIRFQGIPLTVIEEDGLLRLARFALLVIAAGDRTPFVEAFIRWAVSQQVMDGALEINEVSWVLRLTDEDLWPLFQPRLTHLVALHDDTLEKAAYMLLTCLGTQEAINFREMTLQGIYPPNAWQIKHEQDPCTSFFAWTRNDCEPCLQRDDVPLHQLVSHLQLFVADPSLRAPESFVRRLIAEATTISASEYLLYASPTSNDLQIQALEVVLARFAPLTLANFRREVVRTLSSRSAESSRLHFMSLPEVALTLQAPELETLAAVLPTFMTEPSAKEGSENISAYEQRTEAYISLALAMHLPPEELIEHLVTRHLKAEDLTLFEHWFDPLPLHVITRYLDQLQHETHPVRLCRLLWCVARQPLVLTEEQRVRIVALLEHPDAPVRTMATKLTYISEDQVLWDHVLQNGRRFKYESDSLEPFWGSRILCRYGASLSYAELVDRLPLGMLGYAIVKRGCRTEEVEHYALYLDTIWYGIARAKDALDPLPASLREAVEQRDVDVPRLQSAETQECTSMEWSRVANLRAKTPVVSEDLQRSFPVETNEQCVIEETQLLSIECCSEALRAIHLSRPDLVYRWVEAALDETRRAHTLLHWCEGFYRGLCAMLAAEEPELCFRLWGRLRSRGIPVRSIFSAFPFSARESNEAQQERGKMLEACCNDLSLLDLATIATAYKRMDWLIGQSRQLVAMGPLWRQAKGIALACLGDVDIDEVEQLINAAHISGTWVASLLPGLRVYHARNQWAKHWYKRFLTASDRDASWAAFRLFLSCVDRRCWLWIDPMEQECDNTAAFDKTRVQFRLTNFQKIRHAIDRNEQNLKECFLTLKFQDGEIFPFIRDALTTHT